MPIRLLALLSLVAALAACGPTSSGPAPTASPTSAPAVSAPPTRPATPSPAPTSPAPSAVPSPAASRARYLKIVDANAAFARKDLATALRLYRQAADDDSLVEGGSSSPAASAEPSLRAFARFRIVLADAIVGQEDDARATLEQMRQQDAATPYLRLALLFWDTYGMTGDPAPACGQVTKLVQENPDPVLRPLNAVGDANGKLEADDVCRLP